MGKINSITKQTDNRYVNLYNVKATSVHNTPVNYFVSSRAKDVDSLKMVTHKNNPDGVIIYSIYGEKHDKVVLIRQYRYTLGDYIYEFPAGLVEPDENYHEGAIREMYEETGLKLDPIPVAEAYQKPYFTTVGMTDESCATVYGYASGEISSKAQEDTEEIEVILADREEVKRILKEENVAIMTAYMLMHFLEDKEPFGFLNKDNNKIPGNPGILLCSRKFCWNFQALPGRILFIHSIQYPDRRYPPYSFLRYRNQNHLHYQYNPSSHRYLVRNHRRYLLYNPEYRKCHFLSYLQNPQ